MTTDETTDETNAAGQATDSEAVGRAARKRTPRSSHAGFEPTGDRPDPLAILEQQAVTRVADLVPIRYGRMMTSPFAFFRGAAAVMAADLDATPQSGLLTQICGDAHLSNFGTFSSPERRLVFDINDFDETAPGPWEWDVKRFAASLAIAGRENGFNAKQRRSVLLASIERYRLAMLEFAGRTNLAVWYARIEVDSLLAMSKNALDATARRRAAAGAAKARTRDSLTALAKLTQVVDGRRRIVSDPPLVQPLDELVTGVERDTVDTLVLGVLDGYRRSLATDRQHLLGQYRLVDVGRKVVGVGSVGSRAWIVLMVGRDDDDPLILQIKEAQPSVVERFVGPGDAASQGERVVAGQRLMQAVSDIFLGWHRMVGLDGVTRDFYVRQLRDGKGSVRIDAMPPASLAAYGQVCGWTLARAHARSGDRTAIAAYLGGSDTFDRAIADFAEAYADQNERDHAALVAAEQAGRIVAIHGV